LACDLDGDGDQDVLSTSSYRGDGEVVWYENDGGESFTAHTISTTADGAFSAFAADMDGDGDVDVLSASYVDDKIAWYENDGSQSFTEHAISWTADAAWSVFASDLDGDGDLDVLSASYYDGTIAWYENVVLDFGDAPDASYRTLLASDGARHTALGPRLGTNRDGESDGQPTVDADGDDLVGTPDDEDGVVFGLPLGVGQLDASVTVNVQNAPSGAKLDA